MAIPSVVRFWFILIFLIPSILCSIFNLYHFLIDRTLRKALNNHIIIVILFLSLLFNITDIIWLLYYYRNGSSLISTRGFCLTWVYIDFSVFVSLSILMSWASFERHILIFHQNLVATRPKRFLFHYLPMIIFGVYPFLYYIVIFFVLPCSTPVDYTKSRCNLAYCAYENPSIGVWDGIANNLVPVFSIVIFSIALIGRVWYNKYRMGQRFQWRNYRKLTVQLLSISSIYFVFSFPPMIMYTAYSAGLSYDVGADYFSTSTYFVYFTTLLIPFVCTGSLPELRSKLQNLTQIYRRARRAVGPGTLPMTHLAENRAARIGRVVQ